jgi:hypothetical protein
MLRYCGVLISSFFGFDLALGFALLLLALASPLGFSLPSSYLSYDNWRASSIMLPLSSSSFQRAMFECNAKCASNTSLDREAFRACLDGCTAPFARLQNTLTHEANQMQVCCCFCCLRILCHLHCSPYSRCLFGGQFYLFETRNFSDHRIK